ncbi:MAG: BatA domain-containing protein [Saprospiraceae bacterium]|nr:BatA domain-containing protein [Saprospiraceae bacterium]
MQFLYPLFLAALATLVIPVIIHLFYFRRYKKVLFTNVRFLKEIKEESSVRSRLKNLLTLLFRLLAVLFLVLGFAQPFIKKDDNVRKGQKLVSIFVDNSYSMASLSQDAPLLEEAKRKAKDVVNAYDLEDQFQIISHDLSARQQRFYGREQALALIDDLELTPTVNPLSKIFLRQQQLLDEANNPNKLIYYISDFQKNIVDLEITDTTFEYNLIPLRAVIEQNVSIDSAWFEAPVQMVDKANMLLVKVHNWSDQKVENIQLSMRMDGAVKPVGSLDIEARSTYIDTVFITVLQPGIQKVELKITDFPVQFDDTYYLSFNVKQQIQTLVINQDRPNRYVVSALSSEEYFSNTDRNVSNLDYTSFNQYQLIVLNELSSISIGLSSALRNYLSDGGNVLLFPSAQSDLTNYNSFLGQVGGGMLGALDTTNRVVNYFNNNEFVFNDVFEQTRNNIRLPSTTSNFHLSNQGQLVEKLLGYRDGSTYLAKYGVGKGRLYVCAAPLDIDYNNLVTQAEVFIPMLYKMALSTAGESKIAYTIGSDQYVELENDASGSDVVYRVSGPDNFIPSQQSQGRYIILGLHDQVQEAGFYDVYLREGDVLKTYAFNSNRLESDPICLSLDQLKDMFADEVTIIQQTQQANLGEYIQQKDRGIILWKYCLILALIFLALEALIIRFWSV